MHSGTRAGGTRTEHGSESVFGSCSIRGSLFASESSFIPNPSSLPVPCRPRAWERAGCGPFPFIIPRFLTIVNICLYLWFPARCNSLPCKGLCVLTIVYVFVPASVGWRHAKISQVQASKGVVDFGAAPRRRARKTARGGKILRGPRFHRYCADRHAEPRLSSTSFHRIGRKTLDRKAASWQPDGRKPLHRFPCCK